MLHAADYTVGVAMTLCRCIRKPKPSSACIFESALEPFKHLDRSSRTSSKAELLLGSHMFLSPRLTQCRRSEFVDSRAAVQDNDPDYELDEDEEADEPPDDSDEDMEAAPRRCIHYEPRSVQLSNRVTPLPLNIK